MQAFYDLLSINVAPSSSAVRIRKLSGPQMAPGPKFAHAWLRRCGSVFFSSCSTLMWPTADWNSASTVLFECGQHSSAAKKGQEGQEFNSRGRGAFSVCLRGSSPGAPSSSHSPRDVAVSLSPQNSRGVNGCLSPCEGAMMMKWV